MAEEESSCGSRQPMGIFWDMKSCPIPAGVNHVDLADNIIAALGYYLPDYYPKVFFADGDLPSPLSRWERDGLKIHNVGSDCGDYDMFTHMIELSFNHPVAGMLVISQEWDHLRDLASLGELGHRSVLIYAFNEPFPDVDFFDNLVSYLDWSCVANGWIYPSARF